MPIKWNPDELIRKVEAQLIAAGQEFADESAARLKKNISHQGDDTHHSAPGEYPFRQSGDLKNSISSQARLEGNNIIIKVWVDSEDDKVNEYAAYLENGTSRMAPRPFILPTRIDMKKRVKELANKLKGIK